MSILAPSILSSDFVNLESEIHTIEQSGAKWVHIDVMDGMFVSNITIGIPVVAAIRKVTKLILDVHLMINQPLRYVDAFCKAGADIVTVHVEADTEENTVAALDRIHKHGVKAAICLKPGTPAEIAEPFIKYCDMVLIMTVEPGFGGQTFMVDMMPKVKKIADMIQSKNPQCLLQVDGGIDEETSKVCKYYGANVLVSGSSFFKSTNKDLYRSILEQD